MKFRDQFKREAQARNVERNVEKMRSRGGRVTRSISAELRGQRGDRELIKAAKQRERELRRGR